jgi:acyl carrier protein
LREAPPVRRRAILARHLRDVVARVFGLDPSVVEPARPLREIGLDSLLAVELRNAIGHAVARSLPATLLFDYPTVDALTDHVLQDVLQVGTSALQPAGVTGSNVPAQDDASNLSELTEEEAEALLLKELKGGGGDETHGR